MDPVLRFGTFELDPVSAELRDAGVAVRLQPQPFKVLYLLASRAGEVVSREEVRSAIWGEGTHVDFDQGLGFCLSQIRSALGDSAQEPRYVQTLPRRGYRFLCEVARRDEAARSETAPARSRHRPVARTATVAALLSMVLAFVFREPPSGGAAQESRVLLAVLPFEDLSGEDPELPLGEALTEELITEVGRINPRRLSVLARTSAMQFRGRYADLERLRDELQVDYALEGSVRIEGTRVRITTRLVRLTDATQVLVETYERELGDLLALQRLVAADTARHVHVALTPDAQERLATARAVDPEVSHLTLAAGYQARRRTPESLRRAVTYFDQALERDAEHAPAWAGLAETYLALGDRDLLPGGEAFAKAESAARRAIELDPELPAGHASLGGVAAIRDWDWASARASYERALALGGGARVHRWYSHVLMTLGDAEGALSHARRAVELDPLSILANQNLTASLLLSGRFEETLEQVERARRLESAGDSCVGEEARALLGLDRPAEALATIDARMARLGQDHPELHLARAEALRALGRPQEAESELEMLLVACDNGGSFRRARVLAALGRESAALDELEAAVAARDNELRWLELAPEFRSLSDLPRYRELESRLKISSVSS